MNDVIEEAKRLISQSPNAPFVVKELKAFSNAKVTVDFGFVVCSVLFSYIILNKHTIFYGFQHVSDHIFFTTQALDGAMKQYMNLSSQTACMFVSVDEDVGKILAMSRVPKVILSFMFCCVLLIVFYCCQLFLEKLVDKRNTIYCVSSSQEPPSAVC